MDSRLRFILDSIAEFDYCIVGGQALNSYGVFRYTMDFDAFIVATNEDLNRLSSIFKDKGFETDLRLIPEQVLEEPIGSVLTIGMNGEVLFQLIQARHSWQKEAISKKKGYFCVPEFFTVLKIHAGRLGDIADVEMVLKCEKVNKEETVALLKRFDLYEKNDRLIKKLGFTT